MKAKGQFFKLWHKAKKVAGKDSKGNFLALLEADHRTWVEEYKFHPTRKFRFDFAWVEGKVAIEVDGGIWRGAAGGHTSGTGKMRDMEKDMLAQLDGWQVYRFAPNEHERLQFLLRSLK